MSNRLPLSLYQTTIFSPPRESVTPVVFIKAMHPKTEIRPVASSIEKILKSGWAGQLKIHGHRAQVHISADPDQATVVFNRQGRPHKIPLPKSIENELRRVFNLTEGWTVIDAEWLKSKDKLFIFDLLKFNGRSLRPLTYLERFELLPRAYLSPHVKTLPLIHSLDRCFEVLKSEKDFVEGLVFKSLASKGFHDSAIIRCRKSGLKSGNSKGES